MRFITGERIPVAVFMLGMVVSAHAVPWPVISGVFLPERDFPIRQVSYLALDESGNYQVDEDGEPVFGILETRFLPDYPGPFVLRQQVNQTFGAPRGWEGSKGDPDASPPPYLHNGIDIKAPARTSVFAMVGGHFASINPGGDFESIRVGPYRYMHISIPPPMKKLVEGIEDHRDREALLGRLNIHLPAGTLMGSTKRLSSMGAHLHLQWEVDGEYRNVLPELDNWSDTQLPRFQTHDTRDDLNNPQNPRWIQPPIRVVENFDPLLGGVPVAFHDHPTMTDPLNRTILIPIVHGIVDILARVADPDATSRTKLGKSGGAGDHVAPVSLGFAVQRETELAPVTVHPPQSEDLEDPANTDNLLLDTRIDFRRGFPIVKTRDGTGEAQAASSSFTRKLYWFFKEGLAPDRRELGTHRNVGSGLPDRLDYVLTSNAMLPRGDVTSTNPDYFDTNQLPDGTFLPNGRYAIVVRAMHVQAADDPLPDHAESTRTVIFCNKPQITRDPEHVEEANRDRTYFTAGETARLTGRNFFSPSYDEKVMPDVIVRWLSGDTGAEVKRVIPSAEPADGATGNNRDGTICGGSIAREGRRL